MRDRRQKITFDRNGNNLNCGSAAVNVDIPLLQAIHITGFMLGSVVEWLQMMFVKFHPGND
jgi:hypothetical protein